jgi:hypothetical protein
MSQAVVRLDPFMDTSRAFGTSIPSVKIWSFHTAGGWSAFGKHYDADGAEHCGEHKLPKSLCSNVGYISQTLNFRICPLKFQCLYN